VANIYFATHTRVGNIFANKEKDENRSEEEKRG
jgi:hypothetical protein